MKNNYNPYTVPEHFFENSCRHTVIRYRNRRRAILYGTAVAVAAALIMVMPSFIRSVTGQGIVEEEVAANNLAMMYEYDIFLQVNF